MISLMGHPQWPTEGVRPVAVTGDNAKGGSDMKLRFMRAFYAVSLFAMAIAVHGAAVKFR
jgi:hypothetical protein